VIEIDRFHKQEQFKAKIERFVIKMLEHQYEMLVLFDPMAL
jgi:hypothetical protein